MNDAIIFFFDLCRVPLWEQQLTTTGQIFQVIPSTGVWTTTPIPINYAPGSVQVGRCSLLWCYRFKASS
jgi:hypothetical protein